MFWRRISSKAFIVYELLQNAWDQNMSRVEITLTRVEGTHNARIWVSDDDPDGFADLRDAYTLFAESRQKANAEQRGRFNIGEKLVLALAKRAVIETTTGAVEFTEHGRRRVRRQRALGSVFQADVPMTKAEMEEIDGAVRLVIPPAGIVTIYNGKPIKTREPIATFSEALPTLVTDAEGVMRRVVRTTAVRVYEPAEGEVATLYEMGIPVVETADRFHVDISQKVPLNMDRDNVTPAYLRAVRVSVLNATHHLIDKQDAPQTWVREACSDDRVTPEAVKSAVTLRFGANAVSYDPSDPEANKRSQAEGRPVVYGGNLTAAEWQNVRKAGVLPTAGTVTPSPQPYSPDGKPRNLLLESEWSSGGRLTFNVSKGGKGFWEQGITDELNALLIHEFAHHYESDHLSAAYYRALADLGARLTRLALTKPSLFGG